MSDRVVNGFFGGATRSIEHLPSTAGHPERIVKIVSLDQGADDGVGPGASRSERAFNYWAREPMFYRSGILDGRRLPVRPPAVLDVCDRADGSTAITLEYVPEHPAQWSLDDYWLAARHFGRFNAEFLLRPAGEDGAWLSRSWLSAWFVMSATAARDHLRAGGDSAAIIDAVAARARVQRLLACRAELTRRLRPLPKVLCHLDAHRANVVALDEHAATVVDWSYVGFEVLGVDASQLFASSAMRLLIPSGQLAEHRRAVHDGYAEGLRGAGCPPEVVGDVLGRLDLITCLRWGAAGLFWIDALGSPVKLARLEQRWWQRPFDRVAAPLRDVMDFFAELTDATLR